MLWGSGVGVAEGREDGEGRGVKLAEGCGGVSVAEGVAGGVLWCKVGVGSGTAVASGPGSCVRLSGVGKLSSAAGAALQAAREKAARIAMSRSQPTTV